MDRVIYTAMSGAKQLMRRQELHSQNLANASTPGYRQLQAAAESVAVNGEGALKTRAFTAEKSVAADFTQGPVQNTGRPLDVAVAGKGFLAVQALDGTEGYTRAGHFEISPEGTLVTPNGLQVMGDGGPIAIPPDSRVEIADDGSVSAGPPNDPKQRAIVGKLKLVNPETTDLVRGDDGLFRTRDGNPAAADEAVKVVPASLEGSNVNAVEAMVGMIGLARQFELQLKMLEHAQANDRAASQLLSINA
jgi:flagellar basal-body rod protein FlgF